MQVIIKCDVYETMDLDNRLQITWYRYEDLILNLILISQLNLEGSSSRDKQNSDHQHCKEHWACKSQRKPSTNSFIPILHFIH